MSMQISIQTLANINQRNYEEQLVQKYKNYRKAAKAEFEKYKIKFTFNTTWKQETLTKLQGKMLLLAFIKGY